MKLLVVLSAVVACVVGKPGLISPLVGPGLVAPGLLAPGLLAGPAITYAAAPIHHSAIVSAPLVHAAPAPLAVAAPAAIAVAAPVTKTQFHSQDELGNAAFGHSEPGQVHTSVQDAFGNRVGSYSYWNPADGKVHRTDYVADSLGGFRVAANDLPVAPAPVEDTPEVVAAKEALRNYKVDPKDLPVAPAPVEDTPEVVAAREAHLALHRSRRSVLLQTPAATAPLAAPLFARTLVASPLAVAPVVGAPLALSAVPAGIPATLTTIVNNPGHAVSYRVD